MPTYVVDYKLSVHNRIQMRQDLISCFLKEEPGTGKGNASSRYRYNVETYGNYSIYLKRPTQLNKGFDFTVNISGVYFKKKKRYSNPSHQDIFDALTYCLNTFSEGYDAVRKAIVDIYNCINSDLSQINAYFCDHEGTKHPIQIILLAIKWLFIEQDCAYWNYSGRKMLFDGLNARGLT